MRLRTVSWMAVSAVSVSLLLGCPARTLPKPPTLPPEEPCPTASTLEPMAREGKFIAASQPVQGEYIVVLQAPRPGEKQLAPSLAAESLSALAEDDDGRVLFESWMHKGKLRRIAVL